MGNDTIAGGAGNDFLFESGDVNFTLTNTQLTGLGTDKINQIEKVHLTGGASNNLLTAYNVTAIDVMLDGAGGNDTLIGGSQNDTLKGGAGNDLIDGQAADNTLFGGAGNDVFILNSVSGRDFIADFTDGVDRLSLTSNLSFNDLSIANNTAQTAVLIRDTTNNNDLVAIVSNLTAADITVDDFTDI